MERAIQRETSPTKVSDIWTLTLIRDHSTLGCSNHEYHIIEPCDGYNRLFVAKIPPNSMSLPLDSVKSCLPSLRLPLVQLTGEVVSKESVFSDCCHPSNNGGASSYLSLVFLSISQRDGSDGSQKRGALSVFPFLTDVSNGLRTSIQDAMGDVQVEVFHSIAFGDFCVAVRGSSPISGSRLLPYIQNLELNRHGGAGFPPVVCHVLKVIRTAPKDCQADQYGYDIPCGEMCPNWSLSQVESSLVEQKLARLERKVYCLPAPYQAEYLTCCQLILELWNRNKKLLYSTQLFPDGRFFLLQVWLLLSMAEKYADNMISEDKGVTDSNIHTLLEHMRTAAVSIDRFQRQTANDMM